FPPFVKSIAVQPDGRVLIGGSFTNVNGASRNRIARLNADGTVDGSFSSYVEIFFDPDYNPSSVASMAIQPDGKILMAGTFYRIDGVTRRGIARLDAGGTLDTNFAAVSGAPDVRAVALQSDGKVLIGGTFTSINGTNRNRIARLNADGSLDLSFDS